jgi:pre-mRNA-splicing factor CWC26
VYSRVKILDDDIDVKALIPKNIKNTIDEDIGADKPEVADFIDERPRDVIELEKFRQSNRWKTIGQSDGWYQPCEMMSKEVIFGC